MQSLKSRAIRHGLHIAIPVALVLAAGIAVVAVSLNRMADVVNEIESRLTLRSAETAMVSLLNRLGQSHRDYAEWDDAARRLYGGIDDSFITETLGAAAEARVFFDTAYVLDEEKRVAAAVRIADRVDVPLDEAFGSALDILLSRLPAEGRTYIVETGFIRGAWGVAAVAVGPVVPVSSDYVGPPIDRHRYLVLAKSVDEAAIAVVAEEQLIDGLAIVEPGEHPLGSYDLVDPRGERLAALTWAPSSLGSRAYADVAPLVALMLGLISLTVAILVGMAVRGLNKIKASEDRARYDASHDALTGLANRPEMLRRIAGLRGKADGGRTAGALLYLDLDGFKDVNDAYGHDTGDRLLRTIASGFRSVCGECQIARIGGDEFAILLEGEAATLEAENVANRLIRYLSQHFEIDGRVIAVGTSVGVAAIEAGTAQPEEVLRRADVAMYQAKKKGRNRISRYEPAIDAERAMRLEIAAELGAALRADELELAYQPVYSAAASRIVGAEALLRWPHRTGETLPTGLFVQVAEETGLIHDLGAWVLRRACRDAMDWPGIPVSVNVSPSQLRNPNFEILVQHVLNETGLPAGRLELEVTETYLVSNPDQARESIDAIRALGVSVALDDFGTGYSSIGYLRSFSFDRIKLDRSLIVGIGADQRARLFVQATIALADALGLDVIAEGVETEEEAMLLRLAGCWGFQGFFFSRPCSGTELTGLIEGKGREAADRPQAHSA